MNAKGDHKILCTQLISKEILPTARKPPKTKQKIKKYNQKQSKKKKNKKEKNKPTATRPESSLQIHFKLTD